MSKKILGLDLGTNSIGWSLIDTDEKKILGMGSRIIPMDAAEMGKFAEGGSISKTADRTKFRSSRKLYERDHLRRERLHRVLNVLGFLPEHYANDIDFEKHFGKFKDETETKLGWKQNGKKPNGKDKYEFAFQATFQEMLAEFREAQPELFNRKNKKGEEVKIPYDWTIYYLRKKALTKQITKEELAWLILNFNQKRGYYQLRGEEEEEIQNKSVEFYSLKVVDVKAEIKYNLILENGKPYYRSSETPLLDWKDTNKEFVVTTYLEKDGTPKKDKTGNIEQSIFLKDDLSIIKKKTNKKKTNVTIEERAFKIVDVKEEKQDKIWYSLTLENGWIYRRESKSDLSDWKDKVREFIVTTDLNDDGTVKTDDEGKESRSYRAPKEDDWTLIKKKTEDNLEKYISEKKAEKTVGTYIYETLLNNPTQKIRGKLVRTIERKFYKDELKAILEKQIALQPKLFTDDLYNDCVRELYRSNEAHQQQLSQRDFVHLLLEDIIFYQRPLKSQKSSIGNCSLEYREHKINQKDEKGYPIKNVFEKDKNGNDIIIKEYLKAIPKSNPYYQEFRVWQWLYNLKIYNKKDDKDVTGDFIKSTEGREKLFEFLMSKKEMNHKDLLSYLIEPILRERFPNAKPKAFKTELTSEIQKYRWNYVYDAEKDESKGYPMNVTGYEIRKQFEKVKDVPDSFLTREIEQQLWHIIYSVKDKKEYERALESFSKKYSLYYVPKAERDDKNPDEKCFVYNFRKVVWKETDYGAYSEKAIKRLLPLMRLGKFWNENVIIENNNAYLQNIKSLLEKLGKKSEAISEEDKEKWGKSINKELYDELSNFLNGNTAAFQGLRLHIAQYLVYGRHSEAGNINQWQQSFDIQKYLYEFRQHQLRNPIVEQIITETLRIVKDIWEHYAEKDNIPYKMIYDDHKKKTIKSYSKFFDEIHIELGREMKNTADDRKKMTTQISDNENTNQRIKLLLMEFSNDDDFKNQLDYKDKNGETPNSYRKGNNPISPYSPTQHNILKIYEEYVLNDVSKEELDKETGLTETKDGKTKKITYKDISTKSAPTPKEVEKYKLWLEQKYQSPYTGQFISLTKLFTPEYEIEHIIPKSRYFDDSLSNKVICEAAVNKLKGNKLGLEFIKNPGLQIVDIGFGRSVNILTEQKYREFIDEHYSKNKAKWNKLLLEEIPDKMIARQMNDTRYISKFVSQILSNIVRAENNDDGINSKNIIPGNGKITNRLKQDWGLNDVWNELILPRFERMNMLTQTKNFTSKNKEGHIIPSIPFEYSKGFQKKRIDHRHHAMDALIIACATSDHVNLLNNQSAKSDNTRPDLQNKLRNKEKWQDNNGNERDKFTEFKKPWEKFNSDAKDELGKIVVSFKQNLRVINKATNNYVKFENGKKVAKKQEGLNWAIRKSMHEETVSGIVNLPWVKLGKGEITTATRKALDKSFNLDKIEKITDRGIQEILKRYLTQEKFKYEEKGKIKYNPELAFSPEGIEDLNKNIAQFNNGKFHQPIFKVRTYEKGKGRFILGERGNKKKKYVQGAPNLFFAVYQNEDGKRSFETIPLNVVIEREKQRLSSVPDKNEKGNFLCADCAYLSPNDLVYVPTHDELATNTKIDFKNLTNDQKDRIYKVVSFSDSDLLCIKSRIAHYIVPYNRKEKAKGEIGWDNKSAQTMGSDTTIKDVCIKLNVDRLGRPSKAIN